MNDNDPNERVVKIDSTTLANRGATLLALLLRHGYDPLRDPVDLLLVSILPLAIKKARGLDPLSERELVILGTLIELMDLSVLETLIENEAGTLPTLPEQQTKGR